MAGAGVIIGGAFVLAIIKSIVNIGCSYFSDKYKDHKDTQKMLGRLETSLPRILSVIEWAERKQVVQDASLAAWLQQLKDIAYEAEDVIDDFEVKHIRDRLKNKNKVSEITTFPTRAVKNVFLVSNDEMKLKCLLRKLNNICDGIGDLIKMIESADHNASDGSTSSSIRETSSILPKTTKLFGREKEIELILDMIIGYHKVKEGSAQSDIAGEHCAPQISIKDSGFVKNKPRHDGDDSPVSEEINTPGQDISHSALCSTKHKITSSLIPIVKEKLHIFSRQKPEIIWNLLNNIRKFIYNSLKRTNLMVSNRDQEQSDSSDDDYFSFTEEIVSPLLQAPFLTESEKAPVSDNLLPAINNLVGPALDGYPVNEVEEPHYRDSFLMPSMRDLNIARHQHKNHHHLSKSPFLHPSNYSSSRFRSSGIVYSGYNSTNAVTYCVGNRNLEVLPIVGIGGSGKTTIAQAIYNHPMVEEYFELRGWVYVMDSTDYRSLVNDIVLSFDVKTSKSMRSISNLNEGHHRLLQTIEQKRFLLILDDVREEIDLAWKKLLSVLTEGALGSIIIVTTQWKCVARNIGTLPPVFLEGLQWPDFLNLFEYHAFGRFKCTDATANQNFPISHEETKLKPIGEEIARKLHCLPLAAETVGTLLNSNLDMNYWEEILNSDWWNLKSILNNVLCSLGIGFQSLDPGLKQCFIYCSLFPKNYVFNKDRLVQMWIAQGFVRPTILEQCRIEREEIKIEDLGRSMFDKLVDRFFFQTTIWDNRYVMHDLIREVAIVMSSEELYVTSRDVMKTGGICTFTRHLAIDADINADFNVMGWIEKNTKGLRTIMFFGFCKLTKYGIHYILCKLTGLRLLDLSYLGSTRFSLPDKVFSQLSHLRFLDLSFSGITILPKSVCQLVHLQVLNIEGCWFNALPQEMNQLTNLRHLYSSPCTISLIYEIGKLTNLQELEKFSVSKEKGYTIRELTYMNLLSGWLTLENLTNVPSKSEAMGANLDKKKDLTSLSLGFDEFPASKKSIKHMEIMEGLRPHQKIRELIIKNFMLISYPSWMMGIQEINNLRSIKLSQCFHLETLPPLGSLPKLESLTLENLLSILYIGEGFYGTFPVIFPSLKELIFTDLKKWERWSDPGQRKLFPCLQTLNITNCQKLSEVPLHGLNSLVELHLSRCDKVIKNSETYVKSMTSLTQLYLDANEWIQIDICCGQLHELRVLTLGNIIIPSLGRQISSLVNLKKLRFQRVFEKSYKNQPLEAQHMHSLPSLTCIEVHTCNKIPETLLRLGRLPVLKRLWINDFYSSFRFTLDSWFEGLASLEDMELSNCKDLTHLPSSLSTLSSLKKLTMRNCPRVYSLPKEGLPQSLKELHISECSHKLMKECKQNTGAEWSKISHIPYIRVTVVKKQPI